jgi:tetratricopeptide (TPR) repeat protein
MAPQALQQYLEALRVRSGAPEPHLAISQLYKRDGRWKDSIAELEVALKAEPNNAFYQMKVAELYRDTGYREQALIAIQAAVAENPSDSFYHYFMGDLLLEMERYKPALDAFRAAVELSPGDDHLFLRASIAFWRLKKPVEAIKSVRLASDLDPDKNIYYGVLELLLNESGQFDEAILEQKRAENMDRYDREQLRRLSLEFGI